MSGPPFGVTPGEGCKFHLLAIGIAMALILRGGGKWSVDTAISLAQRTMINSTGLRRGESSRASAQAFRRNGESDFQAGCWGAMEQKNNISKTSECKHIVESHPFLAIRVKRGINCAARRSPSLTSS